MSRGLMVMNSVNTLCFLLIILFFVTIKEFVEKSKKALRARAGRNRAQQPKGAYDNPAMNAVDEPGVWNTGVPPPPYQFRPTAPPLSFQR